MKRASENAFGPLAILDNEAAFAEPWQAQIMALAFALAEKGMFSSAQWSEALGAELHKHEADDRTSYYQAALRALEALLLASGNLARANITLREQQWRQAYLATPHGMPVELVAETDG